MTLHEQILDALRTIPDPEMPISIVDLGIVEDVQVNTSRDREGAEIAGRPTAPLPDGRGSFTAGCP